MRVTIMFETDTEEDGYDQTVMLSRDNVNFIQDLLDFYADASRSAGFTYVHRVGYATEKGEQTWGMW